MKLMDSFDSKRGVFSAFTLAEMMVVMLILSIVLAAMAPVMTTRYKSKPNNSSPWLYDNNNRNNIWFGTAPAQHAMIGQNSYGADDTIARLLITVGDDTTNFLAFKRNNTNIGRLFIGGTNLLLGNLASGTLGDGSVGVGRNLQTGANSTAVGSSTNASGASSIAVGQGSNASAENSVAIGSEAKAENYRIDDSNTILSRGAIAIGQSSEAKAARAVAIGNGAKISHVNDSKLSTGAIAIGTTNGTVTGEGSIAIGDNAKAQGSIYKDGYASVISIGKKASADGYHTIAIGEGAQANGRSNRRTSNTTGGGDYNSDWGYSSIAIGANADATVDLSSVSSGDKNSYKINTIAIGTDAKAKAANAMAIGINATADSNSKNSIAIGNDANASTPASTEAAGNSIAIGTNSKASGAYSIAIGSNGGGTSSTGNNWTEAGGQYSIAIGYCASTKDSPYEVGFQGQVRNGAIREGIAIGSYAKAVGNSIAIGSYTKANTVNQIVLGTKDYTVYIPGKLIVGQTSFFGANISGNDYAVAGHWGNSTQGGSDSNGVRAYIGDISNAGFDVQGTARAGVGYDGAFEYITKYSSDRRLKYVGKENKSGLDKIRQLKIFNYTYKKDTTKTPHVGVIAQDLQKVFPNAVKKGADGFLTIRMEDMFYAVINAIKELDAKYQAQEKRINELEKRIEKLEAKAK